MRTLIGTLCMHTTQSELGVGIVIEEQLPPFPPDKLHRSQRTKPAYKVCWLSRPDLNTPFILGEYLTDLEGQRLSDLNVKDKKCPTSSILT